MAQTLNEAIRDELIVQDVTDARAIAGVQKRVDNRLLELQRDLRRVVLEVDPTGTPRRRSQKARTRQANELAAPLIRQAFVDINAITDDALTRMGRLEKKAVADMVNAQVEKFLG